MSYQYPCLFCGDQSRLRTAEHVLQKGFGANLTITDAVCSRCNTEVFSSLDGDLVQHVRNIFYWDHPDAQEKSRSILQLGQKLHFDPVDKIWYTIVVDKELKSTILPQIIFLGDDNVAIAMDPSYQYASMLSEMCNDLKNPSSLQIKSWVMDLEVVEKPKVQTAIIRSASRKYLIRVCRSDLVAKVETAIANGKIALALENIINQNLAPTDKGSQLDANVGILSRIQVEIGNIERALCKSALNVVYKVAGPDVALASEFDPIRKFALDGTKLGDFKFVAQMSFDESKKLEIDLPEFHLISISDTDGYPAILFHLYQRPFACVRFPASTSALLHQVIGTKLVFNYKDRTNEIILPE